MNREAWLRALAELLAPDFAAAGYPLALDKVRVSVGFPGGGSSAHKAIGQCWSAEASADRSAEIFVSPVLGAAADVDHVLVHELAHAATPGAGHKGAFRKLALALGLTGKMTATTAGPELRARLNKLCASLGPYPHARLNLDARKKQTTRMVKLECPGCGYVVRTTRVWLEMGVPTCHCGETFQGGEAE